jgi:hypothetical protein
MSEDPRTFRLLNSQGVESSNGFVVQFTDRFSLEYRDGDFCLKCDVEDSPNGGSVEVPRLPFGNLTPERRTAIVSDISAALKYMGLNYDVG